MGQQMKLVDNLKALDTGNRRSVQEPLHTIKYTSDVFADHRPGFEKRYSITITLGADQWIDEQLVSSSHGEVIQHAVKAMKHSILEHVYGEIHRDLRDLQRELRNENGYRESASIKKLAEIIKKISL
jgi:hypothetical protein